MGDVDLEIIFDMQLTDVEDKKQFQHDLEMELVVAVDCRPTGIHVSTPVFIICVSDPNMQMRMLCRQ